MYTLSKVSTFQCPQQEVSQLRGAACALQGGRRWQAQPSGEAGEGDVGLQVGDLRGDGASVQSDPDHAGRC